MCELCALDPKLRIKHDLSHALFPIPHPFDRSAYDDARREAAATIAPVLTSGEVVHPGIRCDVCNRDALVGVRHKCMDCAGTRSPSSPQPRDQAPTHPSFRVHVPYI